MDTVLTTVSRLSWLTGTTSQRVSTEKGYFKSPLWGSTRRKDTDQALSSLAFDISLLLP